MKIPRRAIVSNSDIIKNYKTQRNNAESLGKLIIFKNNKPDAVLFSISAFDRVAEILEEIDTMDDTELANILEIIKDYKSKTISSL
jgi:PHD/YefM family antitoxin component YafN of YafNO toxin-antitoxin module